MKDRCRGTAMGRFSSTIILVLCVTSAVVTAAEDKSTNAERENIERHQNIELQEDAHQQKSPNGGGGGAGLGGLAGSLGSMFGLPPWLTQNWHPPKWVMSLLSPSASSGGGGVAGGGGSVEAVLNAAAATDAVAAATSVASLSPGGVVSQIGEFTNIWMRAQDFIDRIGNAKTVDDRLRTVLGALEGLDDILRSTVPRLDRFNCLERVMCQIAAPFEGDIQSAGNVLDDGVQTLQQIQDVPSVLQQLPQFLQQGLAALTGNAAPQQQRPNLQQQRPHLQQQLHQQQLFHNAGGNHQFAQPHQQQFLQHQQHQKRYIQQQLLQQQQQQLLQQQQQGQFSQQHPQLHPQQPHRPQLEPVVPPLPYYIPTPKQLEATQQHHQQQLEHIVPRGQQSGEETSGYLDNNIRREEHLAYQSQQEHQQHSHPHQAHTPQQAQQQTQHHVYQQHQQAQHQQAQHQQYQREQPQRHQQHHQLQQQAQAYQHPYQYQQPSVQHGQHSSPQRQQGPPRRRRTSWRRIVGNLFGLNQQRNNQNQENHDNRRRGRRDVTESESEDEDTSARTPRVRGNRSRQTKIAPAFQTPDKTLEVRARNLDSGSIKTTNDINAMDIAAKIQAVNNEIPRDQGPSPVKTLTKADLAIIKSRILAINKKTMDAAAPNSNDATSGRSGSARQARFLTSLLNGWTSNSLLGILDRLMDGYSFHPYTHAAYMGYTSRDGTCSSMYPRCPDDANDMLDLVNNLHQYFPDGIPFRDSIPWPLNLLIP